MFPLYQGFLGSISLSQGFKCILQKEITLRDIHIYRNFGSKSLIEIFSPADFSHTPLDNFLNKLHITSDNRLGRQGSLTFEKVVKGVMAAPRIFISSTCYDLQEIRFQLKRFIEDLGYEPVMSEFGDIFYDLDKHVQDACKEEISKCNLFVLIVGNNYGSVYHKHEDSKTLPDSITLQEFKKALEVGIPKYIFLNRFVQHDFDNYRRALSKELTRYFSENKVDDNDVEKTRKTVKERFDSTYHFAQDAYRYIFYFLDIIYNLDINNAVFPFESFEDIKDMLRKQWAGFFYEALTKERTIAIEEVERLGKKLERVEHQLRLLTINSSIENDNDKRTIDIKKLVSEFDLADLEQVQQIINKTLNDILRDELGQRRVTLNKKFNAKSASEWLAHLNILIQNYKWSEYIPITEIMHGMRYRYWENRVDVPYKSLFELCGIFNSLEDKDKEAFCNTISLKLNGYFESEPEASAVEPF
jgi:hypothetical protein